MNQNKHAADAGLISLLVILIPLLAVWTFGYHTLFIVPLDESISMETVKRQSIFIIDVEYLTTIKAASVVKAQQEGMLSEDISLPAVIDEFRTELLSTIQKRVGDAPVYLKKYILSGSDSSVDITRQVGELMGLDMSLDFINALGSGEQE